ncbi:MAG: response regulator [Chloroflexi bacterium]|nr:MAG: response regulator [Chloroflexota bacterium]
MPARPLLLVAEDDPDDQLLIQDAIDMSCSTDIETHFVWDGIELINYLQGGADGVGKPDLLVLDLNMPRKDGRDALREIKMNPELAKIPVAVLTTSINERDAQYCQQWGVVGYYQKPSSMMELIEIIGGLCTNYLGCEL